jgi:hypothetical protein
MAQLLGEPLKPRKIFLSYRREDSAAATGRLRDALAPEFGADSIFMDVDGIPLGTDFKTSLQAEVARCDTFLAIIGPRWIEIADEKGRRLDDPDDSVRFEIAAALNRNNIPVIPILLDGTKIPRRDQLPSDLQDLADRNAADIRQASFHSDVNPLIRELKKIAPAPASNALGRFALGTIVGLLAGILLLNAIFTLLLEVYTHRTMTGDLIIASAFVILGILGFIATIRIWTMLRIFGASIIGAFFPTVIWIGVALSMAEWVPPVLRKMGPLAFLATYGSFLVLWWRLTSRTGLGWRSKRQ